MVGPVVVSGEVEKLSGAGAVGFLDEALGSGRDPVVEFALGLWGERGDITELAVHLVAKHPDKAAVLIGRAMR